MRPFRALLLLGLAATLAFSPAAQDETKFINDVLDRTKKLDKAYWDFKAQCRKFDAALLEIVDDWKKGFDPSQFNTKRAAVESDFKVAQSQVKTVLQAHPKPADLRNQAKTKKFTKAENTLREYENSSKDLTNVVAMTMATANLPDIKIAAYWKELGKRIQMAGQAQSGIAGSESDYVVPKDGLVAWRAYGGNAKDFGSWWSVGGPAKSAKEARLRSALPPDNWCERIIYVEFHPGTKLHKSAKGPNFGHPAPGEDQYRFDPADYKGAYVQNAIIPAAENPVKAEDAKVLKRTWWGTLN